MWMKSRRQAQSSCSMLVTIYSLTMNMEKRRYIFQMVIYLQAASSYSDRSLLFAHKLTPKRFPAHMYVEVKRKR